MFWCIFKILQAVIEANIIGPLVQLLQNAEFDIKKEAAWAISNATSGGSHEQIKYMISIEISYFHASAVSMFWHACFLFSLLMTGT